MDWLSPDGLPPSANDALESITPWLFKTRTQFSNLTLDLGLDIWISVLVNTSFPDYDPNQGLPSLRARFRHRLIELGLPP